MNAKSKYYHIKIAALLLIVGLFALQPKARATSVTWSVQFGSAGEDDGVGIVTDSSGNVYVGGTTTGSLYATNIGGQDIFLAKYDPSGNFVWGKQIGTIADECVSDIVLDASGNVYLVGSTTGNLFGTNGGSTTQDTEPDDAYIVKFSSGGNQLWGKQFGTSSADYATSIAIDSVGNVIVAGYTEGNLFGTNAGYDSDVTLAYGTEDIFLRKYDGSGNVVWSQQYGQKGDDDVAKIKVDSQDNIILAGETFESFGPPIANAGGAAHHALLVKYNSSGVLIWGLQANGTNTASTGLQNDNYNSLAIDVSNNIIVTGNVNKGDSEFTNQVYIVKYNPAGVVIWENLLTSYDTSGNIEGLGVSQICSDALGKIVIVGYTNGSLFAPNGGGEDAFIAKYNSSGSLVWSGQYGTSSIDAANTCWIDAAGSIYVAGVTNGNLYAQSTGGGDIFLQKVSPIGQMAKASVHFTEPHKTLLFAWAGERLSLLYPPVLANKLPYVYAGYLCSGIPGAKVSRTVRKQMVIEGWGKQVVINPNSLTYQINGKSRKMSAKPVMVGTECYVPLDVMKAVLPYPVHFDAKARTVHFDPPQKKVARK